MGPPKNQPLNRSHTVYAVRTPAYEGFLGFNEPLARLDEVAREELLLGESLQLCQSRSVRSKGPRQPVEAEAFESASCVYFSTSGSEMPRRLCSVCGVLTSSSFLKELGVLARKSVELESGERSHCDPFHTLGGIQGLTKNMVRALVLQ